MSQQSSRPWDGTLRAVTFDCWGTLIYERDVAAGGRARAELLVDTLKQLNVEAELESCEAVLNGVWDRHWELAKQEIETDSLAMAGWALESFGIPDPQAAQRLGQALARVSLGQDIVALDGAAHTLEELARRGIRRGLICDTGFSPGHVVRELLARHGLLELLEVQVFSNEAGVPKPNPRVFHTALSALSIEAQQALHVGDRLRTDVAGARGVGMWSVRITDQFDDPAEIAEADGIAASHTELRELLGISAG